MINKIEIKSGVLCDLLGEKTIRFTPGVNVVWGRNGVGKSLMLKTIAKYCFVDSNGGGGWSKNHVFNFKFSNYDYKYNNQYKSLSDVYEFDKNSKIEIDWSGDACFYMHHDDMIDKIHIMGYEMNGGEWIPGLGRILNVFKKFNHHPSTGQLIKAIAEMLLKVNAPDLTEKDSKYSSYSFVDYIKTRKSEFFGEFKPTLILDEIDSQLDLFNQMWFHKEIVPKLAEKYQIIMVSHSVFAANYYPNIIELDDSLAEIKKELKFNI